MIRDFLSTEFALIYAQVSDNDSLSLEQFVTMCVSQKCNSMLLETIMKVLLLLPQLRKIRELPENAEYVQKLGFVKNTPFNFEDMVKKLVYKKKVQEIREVMNDNKKLFENFKDITDDEEIGKFILLMEIFERSADVHQDSVNKYEMIYQLNKRNIITSDKLEENQISAKEEFYKDYFHKAAEEKELSQVSGFPLNKGTLSSP